MRLIMIVTVTLGLVGFLLAILWGETRTMHRRLREAFAPCDYCGRHPRSRTMFGLIAPVRCPQMEYDLERFLKGER